ncbi:11130_t:CDS:2 [Acaulospora colombiana]|uniref:11130_t:CDS:1 n=1 Tax=Acaulospora colombiana TaxID=27376 RepID=A0ACA9JXK2_9GLOM|nr:11130_t:CDS:2 [Acaulospora colombiana]
MHSLTKSQSLIFQVEKDDIPPVKSFKEEKNLSTRLANTISKLSFIPRNLGQNRKMSTNNSPENGIGLHNGFNPNLNSAKRKSEFSEQNYVASSSLKRTHFPSVSSDEEVVTAADIKQPTIRNDAIELLLNQDQDDIVTPDVNWAEVVRPSAIKFTAHKTLNRNVSSLRLFPGITESTVRALLAPPIEGVILETFGAGNVPDTRTDIMKALKEASDRGVVIVNCTQCMKGMVTDLYATGKSLTKAGVVPGNDMTPECALVKLSYLLSKGDEENRYSPQVVRELMTKNLRGELTVVAQKHRFTFHNRTHKIIQNMIAAAADAKRGGVSDSALMINVQEKVLMEKSIYPILLCSAAGTNDLEGLQLLWESYDGLILNCIDYDGRTPLHIACTAGHARIVKFLLQYGASVHMRDRFGHTPLFEAARNKHENIIKLLRDTGAHFNDAEIDDVMFQVFSAAAKGDVKLLKHFVDAGFDINRTGFDHRTALHQAVAEGRLSVVQYLLSLREINCENKDRWGKKPIDDAEINLGRMWGRDNDREKELREIVRLIREREDNYTSGDVNGVSQKLDNDDNNSFKIGGPGISLDWLGNEHELDESGKEGIHYEELKE